MTQPTEGEAAKRRFVAFTAETIRNAASTEYPNVYPGEDHAWSVEKFRKSFRIEFHENEKYDSSFSLIGINAAIANAYRRILIAEVATLAIENVYVINNTSVIQDEVLAQRLGLIPFTGAKEGFQWLRPFVKPLEGQTGGSVQTDYNTVVLKLDVKCDWVRNGKDLWKRGEREPTKLWENAHVYARQIIWEAKENQLKFFTAPDGVVRPVHPNILIAKLRPGQAINVVMHCHKGIGAEHAKFSPVATGSYRLMPTITITKPIIGTDAKKFARCFPRGVIALKHITEAQANETGSGYESHQADVHAVVVDAMKDTVSRECLRHDEFKDKVKLGRVQDHFIYRVESTGQLESNDVFLEAVKVLKKKCERAKKTLAAM